MPLADLNLQGIIPILPTDMRLRLPSSESQPLALQPLPRLRQESIPADMQAALEEGLRQSGPGAPLLTEEAFFETLAEWRKKSE